MTNKGKHTSKKPFGSHIDTRMHKFDSGKIHKSSIEKEDIEIPDDIELPKEHEIPVLSNSSSVRTDVAAKLGDDKDKTENNSKSSKKGKHTRSTDEAPSNKKDNTTEDDSSSKENSGKHASGDKEDKSKATGDTKADKDSDDSGSDEEPTKDNADRIEDGTGNASDEDSTGPDSDGSQTDSSNDDTKAVKTFDIKEERFFEKHPKAKKKIAIAAGSVFGAVAAIYLIGVLFFNFFMYPNSNIGTIDTSIKTPVPIQQELDSLIENYSFTVKGQGLNAEFSSEDAGMSLDSAKVTENALRSQNPWAWPYEVFLSHDNSHYLKDAITIDLLADVLTAEVDTINASAAHPTNAYIQFVPDTASFEIVPEVPGSILDATKVIDKTTEGVFDLEKSIVLGDESLLEPTVLKDDARLLKALDDAISVLAVNPQLNLNGMSVYTIDASIIGPWVRIGEDFTVGFDPEAMSAWSDEISKSFNTVGKARTFTRHDGKVVNVSGGTYGWKVDTDNLLNLVNEAFAARASSVIEIPVSQSGTGFDAASGRDWGARYVDIDIAEQYARLYDANGAVIWESPIVSGAKGKTDTPTGVYVLNQKAMNVTLRGPMKDGEYEWESKVKYWMPFKGNSVGLHDAPWQSAFGGSRYTQGFGSHGCVNLPSGKASELYSVIQKGDVVVVHY